ncbi:MAG: alpha/beta hydrolase [Bdellovibrionales bacterium]|nr:alpha/beta hydrolase [Bdellovibrionales bacterium]
MVFLTRKFIQRGCLALFWTLSGCSTLLYYPTQVKHADPVKAIGYKPDEIEFSSEDGTHLTGWYFHTHQPKPRGLVVHFHGNAENMTSHFLGLAWMLDEGFDYFIFDYRGYGQSAGNPSPEGTVLDGKAALRWASQKGLPLIVYGQSIGGAIAMRSYWEVRKEIPAKLVVAEGTFASYQSVGRTTLAKSWVTWLFQPFAYLLLSDRWAPGDRIAEFTPTPLLIIHGGQDEVVRPSHGQDVYDRAREPKAIWLVPEAGHINALHINKGAYRAELLARLKQYGF